MSYSPTTMRWSTAEPSGGVPYVDGPNLYTGFGDNPINRVDPTGEKHIIVVFEGLVTNKNRFAQSALLGSLDPKADAAYIYKDQDDRDGIATALKEVAVAASGHHPVTSENPGSKGKLVTCFHDTVIVIGFSFGGDAAIQFANDLKNTYGITVAAGFTVDPRRRSTLGLDAAFNPYSKPSANSWTNFWENGDTAFQGTKVDGAQNIQLKKNDFKEFVKEDVSLDYIYSHAHQDGYVTMQSQVQASLQALIKRVPIEQGHQ